MKKILIYLGIVVLSSVTTVATVLAFSTAKTFPDVNYSDYYGESLSKMTSMGIISGYDNGDFGPHDAVTRAQLVTILDRYDTDVRNMVNIVCFGISKNDLPENMQPTHSTLCKQLVE